MSVVLPAHLRGVFFDALWETSRIWSLPTPPRPMAVRDLSWHLDLTVWSTVRGEPRFDLAPAAVLAGPARFPRHWGNIVVADLSYPLELFRNGERWVIIDGYHRLARAVHEQRPSLEVRLHPDELWERILAA